MARLARYGLALQAFAKMIGPCLRSGRFLSPETSVTCRELAFRVMLTKMISPLVSLLASLTFAVSAKDNFQAVEPAVFMLECRLATGQTSFGTGFLITDSGWLVTNDHVIDGAVSIVARQGKIKIPVSGVYGRLKKPDLAVLQLELEKVPKFETKPLSLAETAQSLGRGIDIFTLGHPAGIKVAEGTQGTITAVEEEPLFRLRFDAAISQGSSGSPLCLAADRKVVGIVTSYHTMGQKFNYATPVDELRGLLDKMGVEPELRPLFGGSLFGAKSGIGTNLVISAVFFAALIFGVRRLIRAGS